LFAPRVFEREELEAHAAAFAGAFELASVGMALLSLDDHRLVRVNREWCELLKWTEAEMLELTNEDLTHPDDIPASLKRVETMLDGSANRHQCEKRVKCGDGSYKWMLVSTVLIRDNEGRPLFVFSQIQDITALKHLQEELAEQATLDSLTGLPNRRTVLMTLENELRDARAAQRAMSLLFVDLDDFKRVNDERGHAEGDLLLMQVAHAMRAAVRPTDMLGRFGGDEFVLVCPTASDEGDALAIASRVMCGLRRVGVDASIGAVVVPTSVHASTERVLERADIAMYAAKRRATRSRVEVVTLT